MSIRPSYHYQNGDTPLLHYVVNSEFGSFVDHTAPSTEVAPPLIDTRFEAGAYVPQSTIYTCYAAALASIWRAAGHDTSEQDFVNLADHACGMGLTRAVSLLQIISAVNVKVTGQPYNYASTNAPQLFQYLQEGTLSSVDCHQYPRFLNTSPDCARVSFYRNDQYLSQLFLENFAHMNAIPTVQIPAPFDGDDISISLNLYEPVEWQSQQQQIDGGIFPLATTGDIATYMSQHYFLLMGLNDTGGGHVVVLTGVKFIPSGYVGLNGDAHSFVLDENTKIVGLRILDPATPANPEYWVDNPDKVYFDKIRFVLAFRIP